MQHLLPHLPYFTEVARTKSFTKAAEELNITQAAVSYQVKQLEEKVGVQLILRQSGSQLKLTAAGENLAKEYAYCAKRLTQALRQLHHNENHGEIRISAPVDFGSLLMPKVISWLMQHFPGLWIDLHTSDQIVDLHRSRWELAVRVNSQLQVRHSRPLLQSRIKLVASPNYLKRTGNLQNLGQLEQHVALIRQGSKMRSWTRLLEIDNLSPDVLRSRLVLGNSFALRQAALVDLGIAILPAFIVHDDLLSGQLVSLLPRKTDEMPAASFFLASIDTPQSDSYETCLRDAFRAVYGEIIEG